MEVKNEQQDEDITFSNTDANGKITHIIILTKKNSAIHGHNVNSMHEIIH